MAKLIFTDDKFSGQTYELLLEKTTVGRGNDNVLVIQDSSLSNHHCEILTHGPEVIIRDLGSKNGTYVDGARLQNQQSQLKPGGTVAFGKVEARLELGPSDRPREDDAETAIFLHKEILREQRRARNRPPAESPMKTMQPGSETAWEEQTVLIPRSEVLSQPLSLSDDMKADEPSSRRSSSKLWILGAVLALALLAIGWLIWRQH